MNTKFRIAALLLTLSFILSACGVSPAPVATQLPAEKTSEPTVPVISSAEDDEEDVLYVNLVWHQHQPLYYKNEDGVYTRPWVRAHATKDYYDMASTVAQYPDVHVTYNLTPVLISQLDDYTQNGAKDLYWVISEIPADQLTLDQKRFILERFFDVNWNNIISRFPRYQELLDKRGGTDEEKINAALETFTQQDYLDLQIWFNLAWFDPQFLETEPLNKMVEKGRNFEESDKAILFGEVEKVMQEIIPLHKQLQDQGQIEIITTPYAHPILPLIYNTDLALVGNPGADMPERFSWPNDAIAHLEKSVEIYQDHFGKSPTGLWPGEGSVAEEIIPLVSKAGYQWMATGEPVLAASLGIGSFTRDANDTVKQADDLYRPYYVTGSNGEQVAVFFRDWTISDKLGFEYSDMSGEEAADDLMVRLNNIRTELKNEGAAGPHIVSIILDGENAWEYYKNDGKEFLNSMYQKLSADENIKTITPSEYLKKFPEQKTLDYLFPGAWFSPNYDTWIGEPEEKLAWNYLGMVRNDLAKYDLTKKRTASPEAIAEAENYMYLAEGSDWFWWYGSDQDSGQDEYFDQGFRALLSKVYQALGDPIPEFLNVPIIPAKPAEPQQAFEGLFTPNVDGVISKEEWAKGESYSVAGSGFTGNLEIGLDQKNLYVQMMSEDQALPQNLSIYISTPKSSSTNSFAIEKESETQQSVVLGFPASYSFVWQSGNQWKGYQVVDGTWQPVSDLGKIVVSGRNLEASIPLDALGSLETGDSLFLTVVFEGQNILIPVEGPAQFVFPDLGLSTLLLEVEDPQGDDFGPGSYTYPTDVVFEPQSFDIQKFKVLSDESNLIFEFVFYGPIPNPWGSTMNLSLQTLDVYVDKDPGQGTGARLLLPGRNAALPAEDGWDYAVWAEGWYPALVVPDLETSEPKKLNIDFKVISDPSKQKVTIRVPKDAFGEGDPQDWGFAAVVLSQEGFPAKGVWRVRDIKSANDQWAFGGAPDDTNHTRIIDVAWPDGNAVSQGQMLSDYSSSSESLDSLTADDFPKIYLLTIN